MIPLVLNTPEPMIKIRIMTIRDYSEKALKILHRVGVLHVDQSEELKPIDKVAIEQGRSEVSQLLTCVDEILAYIPKEEKPSLAEDIEVVYTRPFSELSGEVRSVSTRLTNLHQRTIAPSQEVKRLTELKRYLEPLAQDTDLRLKDLNFSGDYLFSRVFVFPSQIYETLSHELKNYLFGSIVTTIENETVFYIVGKAKDQKTIDTLITDAGGRILQIPGEDLTLREFLDVAGDRISSLEQELAKLYEELRSKARENLDRLGLLKEVLLAESERLSVLEKACEAKYVTLIEGWAPETNIEPAISELKDSIDYAFIDTKQPERLEEPPTKLRNLRGLRPFQVIVNLFATPKYREWDPTPIIAYSFALFFGLMVGDVVYALGIILLARFLLGRFVDDPESEGFKLFQRLLYISGCVALVIGLLTGTYLGDIYKLFGIESLALVEGVKQALQDPILFITLALVIGFVHVNIGHLLALIKGVKERQKGLVLNKIGLFLLQFGILPIFHFLFHVNIPGFTAQMYTIFLYIMFAGVILVIVGCIMQRGSLGVVLWLFDITGILGDIMSYCRLAGVGLATFYLASCFNMLAGLFGNIIPGVAGVVIGGIIGILILVFGHIINMALSAITGFIHSLRLCFVEFLFKFYEGGGREYSPFKLRTRTAVVIEPKS